MNVEKVRYMISDAADMVHVETHVLRYWEEELDLTIPRNEMGHRYYTRDNIKEFQKIKDLKDQGYQLRAIRMILHSDELENLDHMKEEIKAKLTEDSTIKELPSDSLKRQEMLSSLQETENLSPEERMSQFRELMSDIVGRAIAQNNEELSQTIGKDMQEMVLKEMNYLMREQDNAEEERYKKLDAAIRGSIKRKPLFAKKEKKEKKEKKAKDVRLKEKHR